jgi:outer membrane lipoprotein-sorting protein
MRIPFLALCAAVSLACGAAHAAEAAKAYTVDELVQKHIQARGGADKLKAIQNVRIEGTTTNTGQGFELQTVLLAKRPQAVRMELTLQGLTIVRAYDGKEGWAINPFRGRKDPEKMSQDVAKEMAYQADFDGPLVDYKAKGNKVEYLGTEDVDGTSAHKLKVTRANGDVDTIYLDPDYFLQIRVLEQHRIRGAEVEQESDFGDYEQVDGVYFPFSIDSGDKGSGEKGQKLTVSKVELNVAADDAQFRFPTAAAPAK